MAFSRRVFLHSTALAAAALTVVRRVAGAHGVPSSQAPPDRSQGRSQTQPGALTGLEAGALRPLADAVLPAALGSARIERASNAFARWIAGYREGEELVHPYGSERIGTTGPSPAATWAAQLAALDTAARAAYGSAFSGLPLAQRTALVQQALATVQYTANVPSPIAAPHIALALLAHFLDSSDARNLAYNRVIDPRQCRPLGASPNQPVTLARGGRA